MGTSFSEDLGSRGVTGYGPVRDPWVPCYSGRGAVIPLVTLWTIKVLRTFRMTPLGASFSNPMDSQVVHRSWDLVVKTSKFETPVSGPQHLFNW